MDKSDKDFIKSLIFFFLLAIFFVLASIFSQNYKDQISRLVGHNIIGIFIYLLLIILEVVFAPINLAPLIVIAANTWGVLTTIIFTVVGWTLGSSIAFWIARIYGIDIVRRFVSKKNISKIQNKIPNKHIFISLILLRVFLPFDILSYAMGLFSKIKFKTFFSATIIGVTPSAIILSYLGIIPIIYQIISFLSIGILILLRYLFIKKVKKNKKIKNK